MLRKLASVLLGISVLSGAFVSLPVSVHADAPVIKNIIYMIPDGGGMSPYYLADAVKEAGGYDNKEIYPYVTQTGAGHLHLNDHLRGAITTYSASSEVTDSAAAGTALAAGYKTNNGYIGITPEHKPVASILEACQLMDKATGMVLTYDWANATPAAFSAHDISRSNGAVLSEQITNQDIDVVLGVGFYMAYSDISEAEKRGYDIINDRAELDKVKKGDRIWGNLEMKSFPYDINNNVDTVTLAEMTRAAITALSDSNENGFFLMVEGSQVDGAGHNNNAKAMAGEFLAFDEAFGAAVEYAKGRNDTVVIACPDHDTGGMNLPEDLSAAVKELREGREPEDITWTTASHTNRNGGLFIYVPDGVAYPDGIDINAGSPFEDNVIDNTALIPYLAKLIGADMEAATSSLFVDVTDKGSYDEGSGLFVFNDHSVSVKRNTSYAFVGDRTVDLDGQVAVRIEGRFYVPRKLINIMEGRAEAVEYKIEPIAPKLICTMQTETDVSVQMKIKNYFPDKELSGYISFSAPESFAALGKIDFGTIKGCEEKTVDIPCGDVDKNGCDFKYEITIDNSGSYTFRDRFGGLLYAAYAEKGVTVDGIVDDEWADAPKTVCDDVSMLIDEPNWKGYRDLSAVFSAMYDEKYLYFYATVTDETFHQDKDPAEMWKADSIQFGFYNDTEGLYARKAAGAKYDGINFALINDEPVIYRSQRTTRIYPQGVMEQGDDVRLACRRDMIDLTYEIKLSWEQLFGYDYMPQSGDILAFAFVANDNDGEGRRGAMIYGDGIVGTKDVNKFVPMYFLDNSRASKPTENRYVRVFLDDNEIGFTSKPFISKERTMVPAVEFLDAAGIAWHKNENDNIVFSAGDAPVELAAGQTLENSDIVTTARDTVMFMPLRAVCELLGKELTWDGQNKSVHIKN